MLGYAFWLVHGGEYVDRLKRGVVEGSAQGGHD